jgi:hypothetical protein
MEVISLLSRAKALGFDLGQIIAFGIMYGVLRTDLMKIFDRQFDKLIEAIKSLEKAHNDRLNKIEAHVGLKGLPREGYKHEPRDQTGITDYS